MTNRIRRVVILFAGLLLAACQQPGSRTGFYSSPLQPGDEVVILKPIVVPPEMARVYLQKGQTLGYGSTDQYTPFCYFLLRDPLPAEQTIEPGVLVVDSVWLDETSVRLQQPLRVAGIGIGVGGGRMPMAYQFHIRLRSAQQGLLTLVCSGAFEEPLLARPIRLPEVREALGDYAEIRIKPAAPAAAPGGAP